MGAVCLCFCCDCEYWVAEEEDVFSLACRDHAVLLAGYPGILLRFAWCQAIVGNALYFKDGPFSAHQQQLDFASRGELYSAHNLYQSFRFFSFDVFETIGIYLSFAVLVCIALYLIRNLTNKFIEKVLIALILLSPFFFYVYALYAGIAIIFVPGAVPIGKPQFFMFVMLRR